MKRVTATLRAGAPLRVLEGFGRALRAPARHAAPRSIEDLQIVLGRAREERLSVSFRGSGRSYGDASLTDGGLSVDLTGLDRMLAWDPQTGIAECQPGVTIEGLWRRTLMDGYWPPVVPGTMAPTLAGCLAMNIHGKNNFKAGPIGDHVVDFDLLTADGSVLRCSRRENADVFHAAIGGLGLLGAFTRIRLQLKHVEAGRLRVDQIVTRTLDETFDKFEQRLPVADYLVGWVDSTAGGTGLGRGVLHQANYLRGHEDADGKDAFKTERQTLPSSILGVPKSVLWRFMRPFANNAGWTLVNSAKYWASRRKGDFTYLQSHVGFAFLLDYVPNWRLAYGPGGFIQYQVFAPHAVARRLLRQLLELGRKRHLPSYLVVLKRHRPDPFLLTHALDGWSFAMDFTARDRDKLWKVTEEMTELVLAAGGKFYFAKDAVLRPADVEQAYGTATLEQFFALKRRLDPDALFSSDLARRVFPKWLPPAPGSGPASNVSDFEEISATALETAATMVPPRKPSPPPPLPAAARASIRDPVES